MPRKNHPPKHYEPVERPILVASTGDSLRFGHLPAKEPCQECPVARASTPGYLGGYTPEQYLAVLHGPADLACHLSKGFAEGNRATQRSCTGVAVYRANYGLKPLGANAMDAVRAVKPNRELVFASPEEFLRHHKGEPPE